MTRLLSLLGAAVLGAGLLWLAKSRDPVQVPSAPLLAVENLGHLASLRLNYADVVEFSDAIAIDIPLTQRYVPLGSATALLVARGHCIVGTDLRAARCVSKDEGQRKAVLALVAPKRISAGIQQGAASGGSYLYAVTAKGLAPILPDSENRRRAINNAYAKAQRQLEGYCDGADVLAQARKNAEEVLTPLVSANGWNVRIQWQ